MNHCALLGASPAYRRGLRDGLAEHHWTLDPIDEPADIEPTHNFVLTWLSTPDPAQLPTPDATTPPLVALTPEPIAEDHVALLKAGATAVANSDDDPAHIATLLDALRDGHTILPVGTMHRLAAIARSQHDHPDLADTEITWLRELADGTTVRDLAHRHGWSDRAMHRALTALYRRLDVGNRAQAVAWAARQGLLDDHDG